jgi:hypothetical protein
MSRQKKLARYAPFAIGAVALVVGLGLAWSPARPGGGEAGPTAPHPEGGALDGAVDASPTADAAAPEPVDEPQERYAPDLTGEDLGELIVESKTSAHGLIVTDGQLVWLTTKAGTLYSAPLGGGSPRRLFASTVPDAFGGMIVSGDSKIYWSVEQADGGAESIFGMTKGELTGTQTASRPLVQEGSPDHLLAKGDDLYWSDHGVIMTLAAGETEARGVADRKQLIAAMALADGRLAWLEVPYQSAVEGGHAVVIMDPDGDQARVLAPSRVKLRRELLLGDGQRLFWVEGKEDGPWFLVGTGAAGGPTRRLAQTGAVTALATDGERLYWAEHHGEGAQVVTVLRAVAHEGGQVSRLGRDSGPVPAMAVHGGKLFWATGGGLKRLALD